MSQPRIQRKKVAPVLAFALLAAFSALSARAAVLEGTVRSSSGPLPGMTVAAYDSTGSVAASATTDTSGRYKIPNFGGGRIHLLAYDPIGTYATAFSSGADSYEGSPELNVAAGDSITTDFDMALGAAIAGTALIAKAPAVGMTVAVYNLSGTKRGFTRTNAQGAYSLVVPSGSYKLVLYDDAGIYATSFYASKLSFGDANVLTVKAPNAERIDFTVAMTGSIGGSTVDRATNVVLPGIKVYAYTLTGNLAASTVTNSAGRFRILVGAGGFRLVAGDPAGTYATAFGGDVGTFAAVPTVLVASGQAAADSTIVMDRAGRLGGKVTDAAGHTIPSARVSAYNLDGTIRTQSLGDVNGGYTLLLPGGSFKLSAWDDQIVYVPAFYQQRRDFGGATAVPVASGQIANGLDFSLDKAGIFAGTVKDSGSGTPLPSMTVAAYDANLVAVATASTDATGAYRLGVPAGTYRLVAWDNARTFANAFDGGASNLEATAPRTIASEQTLTASFAMRPGILVSGKVVTAALTPVAGIEVAALDTAGNHVAAATSGTDGSFSIVLLPGSYKLSATDPSGRFPSSFYDRTGTLASSATVLVPTSGPPAPLTIVVSTPSRRRAAGH